MVDPEAGILAGRTVLVVEDEYFIARDMELAFTRGGATVIGPTSNVADALELIGRTDRLDGAVLDLNLQGETAYPVADALRARGVPFVFATGYDAGSVAPPYQTVALCEKPVASRVLARVLFG